MNQIPSQDVAEVTSVAVNTSRKNRLSRGTLNFIERMQFHFPDENLDFTVDDKKQFTDPKTQLFFKIFDQGRNAQRFFEPELFIVGKLTDDGEIQFSNRPRVMLSPNRAKKAAENMQARFGGIYLTFGLAKAMTSVLVSRMLATTKNDLENLKVVVRTNQNAK